MVCLPASDETCAPATRNCWIRRVRVEPVAGGAGEGGVSGGCYKAFLLNLDECRICSKCAGDRARSKADDRPHREGEEVLEVIYVICNNLSHGHGNGYIC